jgi:hypothetical protein
MIQFPTEYGQTVSADNLHEIEEQTDYTTRGKKKPNEFSPPIST